MGQPQFIDVFCEMPVGTIRVYNREKGFGFIKQDGATGTAEQEEAWKLWGGAGQAARLNDGELTLVNTLVSFVRAFDAIRPQAAILCRIS
jgi:hypothetical protein